jgi:hypothetical protein
MPSMRRLAFEECGGPKGATPNIGLESQACNQPSVVQFLGGNWDAATMRRLAEHMMAYFDGNQRCCV